MYDFLFVALVIGFFALAALFVRACEAIVGRPGEGVEEDAAPLDVAIGSTPAPGARP